jgi:CspA family cold shock protein
MATGKVKWFNDAKGYGFITPDDGSEDVFCHWRSIIAPGGGFRTLSADVRVEFDTSREPKGLSAKRVRVVASS